MKNEQTKLEEQQALAPVSGLGGGDAPDFASELVNLINKRSIENGSDTPDFILAQYLTNCLRAWNTATRAREKWYGREPMPAFPPATPPPGGWPQPEPPNKEVSIER